jgi:P27 family predicted phage terminase small subunit
VNLSAKKPTNLKLLEGNPGKRPINKNEVKPEIAIPKCPSWLDKEAKKEWKRISTQLYHLKLLTHIDLAGLASYCYYYSRWIGAAQNLIGEDEILISPKGGRYINPRINLISSYNKIMRDYLSKFGLTPSDRANLDMIMNDDDEDSGILKYLS